MVPAFDDFRDLAHFVECLSFGGEVGDLGLWEFLVASLEGFDAHGLVHGVTCDLYEFGGGDGLEGAAFETSGHFAQHVAEEPLLFECGDDVGWSGPANGFDGALCVGVCGGDGGVNVFEDALDALVSGVIRQALFSTSSAQVKVPSSWSCAQPKVPSLWNQTRLSLGVE